MRQVFMRLSPPSSSSSLSPYLFSIPPSTASSSWLVYCFILFTPLPEKLLELLKFGLSARQNWANFAASLGKQLRKSLSLSV